MARLTARIVRLERVVHVGLEAELQAMSDDELEARRDGDTLTILTTDHGQHRVRLAGIDTPEKRQPFGRVAKGHLSSLVNGQTVTVQLRQARSLRPHRRQGTQKIS